MIEPMEIQDLEKELEEYSITVVDNSDYITLMFLDRYNICTISKKDRFAFDTYNTDFVAIPEKYQSPVLDIISDFSKNLRLKDEVQIIYKLTCKIRSSEKREELYFRNRESARAYVKNKYNEDIKDSSMLGVDLYYFSLDKVELKD